MSSQILTDPEIRRYDTQMKLPGIGISGQEIIKQLKIGVVGAGGIGAQVLQSLAAMGVGMLGIIDDAMVHEANIQKQTLYGGKDLGKLKTIISKSNLQNLFPLDNFEIINLKLTENNIERILQEFQVVVDATNDINSHQLINKACYKLNLPWIIGGALNFDGFVSVLNFGSVQNYDLFLTYLKNKYYSDSSLNKGASVLTYGIIAKLMANEVFKTFITPDTALVNKIIQYNTNNYIFSIELISELDLNK